MKEQQDATERKQRDNIKTDRLSPVKDLFKLVEACNRCSAVFRVADERLQDDAFRGFHDRLQKTLDRFVFELKKESSRIGSSGPWDLRPCEVRCDNGTAPLAQAGTELQSTLRGYDTLLARPLPPHARAMIQRQRQTLDQLLSDLDRFSKVESVE